MVSRDASLQAIAEQFGVQASALRVYVHYQPTYYHFHVHFSHVKITDGTHTGKAVLLEDIIYNLSRDGDYYRHASLTYVIGEMQHKPLYDLFVEHGVLGPKRA
jgi:m7GpppX diphosphatase